MTGPWSSRCTSVGRADAWLIDVVLGKEVADDYRIVVQARPDAIRRLLTSTRHWTACRRSRKVGARSVWPAHAGHPMSRLGYPRPAPPTMLASQREDDGNAAVHR